METIRRLSAILIADVAGYSRLMGQDEGETVRRLSEFRQVFAEQIATAHGRIVNAPGDSILAEFSSVVDAVACAVEIQRELAEKNAALPDDHRMRFRIGINLGDVILQGEEIYGDGVNIAARLQALAEPGGICVSGSVFDSVQGRLELDFQFLGEQAVKNIRQPVRAYQVLSAPGAAGGQIAHRHTADSVLAIPSGPTIAVLPFVNLSSDPEQEYFSDGLTEDIITGLSRFKELFVIARHSTFKYKGTSPDVREVGRNLGVRYVLEGSVRRAGERVRITAQLIDSTTNAHLWAESFDRELKDVFAVQDEITHHICGCLGARIEREDLERAWRKPPEKMEAYDLVLQARRYRYHLPAEQHGPARDLLERAVWLDPNYGPAYGDLAWLYLDEFRYGYNPRPHSLDRALEAARRAVDLVPDDAAAHSVLAKIHFFRKELAGFETEANTALALNPNHAETIGDFANHLCFIGRLDEAYELARKALRLDPRPSGWYYFTTATYHYLHGRYPEALAEFLRANMPEFPYYHAWLAMVYGRMGRIEAAKAAAAEALRLKPDLDYEQHYRDYNFPPGQLEEFMKGARVAGLK